MRPGLLIGLGLAAVLMGVNASIAAKERLLASGTPVLLELGPADPRSLIQGDYMVLRYAMAEELEAQEAGAGRREGAGPRGGRLVLRLDARGVAHLVRVYRDGEPLRPGEQLLRYRVRRGRVRLGAESFFFQEGMADLYAQARYAELRVSPEGESVLVGLRDEALRPLGPGPR